MKRAILTLSCLLVLTTSALAQGEHDYTFGTSLVLSSPRQLADPNKTWWGDLLPMEYRFSIGSIVDAVNKARKARGETVMIDVTTYPVNVGSEMLVGNSYEYNIDFLKMQPVDVEVVMAQFPLTGIFSDLKRELRPVRIGYYWGNNPDGGAVNLELPGGTFTVGPDESFSTVKQRIAEALQAAFGGRAKFDLSMNRYSSALGSSTFDISVTVYLDGAEAQMNYPAEGEHDI